METSTWVWIIFWFICGILEYGFNIAMFRNKYGELNDNTKIYYINLFMSLLSALFGPLTLATSIIRGDYKYGWSIK